MQLDSANLLAAMEYGLNLADRGELDEAEDVQRRSPSLAPNQPVVCQNPANLLLDTARISEALPLLEQAIQFEPPYDKTRDGIRALYKGRHGTQAGPR